MEQPNNTVLYEFCLNLVSDAVIVLDGIREWKTSKVVFANASLSDKLGYKSKELTNGVARNIIDDLAYTEDELESNYNGMDIGAIYKGRITFISKSLEKKMLSFTARTCLVPRDDRVHYVFTLRTPVARALSFRMPAASRLGATSNNSLSHLKCNTENCCEKARVAAVISNNIHIKLVDELKKQVEANRHYG
jgi:PAS domain-containing protein